MTGVEYECWVEHLLWDARVKSGKPAGFKFKGDPKVYERWKKKVGSMASINALVRNAVFEKEKERERRRVEKEGIRDANRAREVGRPVHAGQQGVFD